MQSGRDAVRSQKADLQPRRYEVAIHVVLDRQAGIGEKVDLIGEPRFERHDHRNVDQTAVLRIVELDRFNDFGLLF